MKKIDLGQTIGILANIGVIAGIVFLAVEIRQSRELAISDFDANFFASNLAVTSEINEHADVWIKALRGEELGAAEAVIFKNLVVAVDGRYWVNYRNAENLNDMEVASTIIHDFAAFLHSRPPVAEEWLAYQEELARSREVLVPDGDLFPFWRALILADLEKLDEAAR